MLAAVYVGEQFTVVWRGSDGPLRPEPAGRRCVDCGELTRSPRAVRCDPCRRERMHYHDTRAKWDRKARLNARLDGLCSSCRRSEPRAGFATCGPCAQAAAVRGDTEKPWLFQGSKQGSP